MSEVTSFNINGQEVNIANSSTIISENSTLYVNEDDSLASLNIGDESGNVLVEFKNGHIKTKNFDSRNINSSSNTSSETSDTYGIRYDLCTEIYKTDDVYQNDAQMRRLLSDDDTVKPLIIVGGQSNSAGKAPISSAPDWLSENNYILPDFYMLTNSGTSFSLYNAKTNTGCSNTNVYSHDVCFAYNYLSVNSNSVG